MNTLALQIVSALVRTGIVLSLSALAVAACLRVFRVASPTVRRIVCVAVLLQGWLLFQGPFSLPLPSRLSEFVGWPDVVVRLFGNSPVRVALAGQSSRQWHPTQLTLPGATPTARRGRARQTSNGERQTDSHAHAKPWAWHPTSGFTAFLGEKRVNGVEWHPVRMSKVESGQKDPLTLAAEHERTSLLSQMSTGGPVAPEAESAGSVVVSAGELPTNQPPFPLALALALLWVAGIAFIGGRSAWAYVRFVRRFPASSETPPEWADEWTSLQIEAGLPGIVPLVVAEHAGPVLCRMPRGYCLIVPGEAWRTLEPSQRLLILRHELAHIERRDVWKSLVVRILALPHWFNPLAWRIVRRFDESAEWACDEAATGAAPDRIPDYARALLQLGHRAQPAFFATSAARTQGLSGRIRRLLTPGAKKETKMKMALLTALLLGISLVNVTRLQTRAEDTPAGDDKQQTSQARPATADKPATTAQDSKQQRGFVTIQASVLEQNVARSSVTKLNVVEAPVIKLNVVASPVTKLHAVSFPVTQANTLPAPTTTITVVPPPASTAKSVPVARRITIEVPVTKTILVPTTVRVVEKKQIFVDEKGHITKTPAPAATPPTKTVRHTLRPGKGIRVAGKGAMRIKAGPSVIEMLDGEIRFGLSGVADVIAIPREARVNLPYILEHMHQFQREREELKASLAENERRQAGEAGDLEIAKKRLDQETDIGFRSFLERAIAQSRTEMQREHREGSDKLIQQEHEMFHRNMQRILEEIARYAKKHKILIVRRMPFAHENHAAAGPAAPQARAVSATAAPSLPAPTATVPFMPLPPPTATAPVTPPPGSSGLLPPVVPAMRSGSAAMAPAGGSAVGMPPAASALLDAPPPVRAQSNGMPAGVAAVRNSVPWPTSQPVIPLPNPPEVLYVAEVRDALIPDISDEIVKRLNAADEAKGKTPSGTAK